MLKMKQILKILIYTVLSYNFLKVKKKLIVCIKGPYTIELISKPDTLLSLILSNGHGSYEKLNSTFSDDVRAPIPQRNETLIEDVPAFGRNMLLIKSVL